MTTSRLPPNYYTSDEFSYGNNTARFTPGRNHPYVPSNNNRGVVTNKTKEGTYNVIEKDFGDHKVIYHVPFEYGDNFDISQLEDLPPVNQQPQPYNEPVLVQRRIIQHYNDFDDTDRYEYVEEIPASKRRVYVSAHRPGSPEIVTKRVYETEPPKKTIEYIYEDDNSVIYDDRPPIEEVEYVVRDRVPRQPYVEDVRPSRRAVYVQDPSIPISTSRQPPPPPPPPQVLQSSRRSPYQPTPRTHRSASPPITKPIYRNKPPLPLAATRKQPTPRSPSLYEPPVKPNIPKTSEPPLRLMDIIAENRARRGTRIPKPRREVDEEKVYDKPTYQRNIIKNGFIVHK